MYDYIPNSLADKETLDHNFGVKHNTHGLMHDQHIRTFYRPVDHTIRDWQHVLVSGGVANTECALVIKTLVNAGLSLTMIGDWVESFVLPHRVGKSTSEWVSKKRLGKNMDQLASLQLF